MNPSQKVLLLFWRENMRRPRLFIGTCLSWLTGMTLQKLILALITAKAINKLVQLHAAGNHTTDYWSVFWPYLALFIATAIIAQGLIDFGLYLLSRLETTVRPVLQRRAFAWLTAQSLNFHANNFGGALVNQVTKFASAYVALTDTFVLTILKMITNVVIAIIVIAFFSPLIALAMLVWTVLFVILSITLVRRRIVHSKVAAAALTQLTAHLADDMSNIAAIKAFGTEESEIVMHDDKSRYFSAKKFTSWMAGLKNDVVLGLMMSMLQFAVLALSIYAVMNNQIEVGTLLLIQVYLTQIIGELWGLSNISRNVEQAITDAEEMIEVFDIEPDVQDPAKPEKSRINKGAITFNAVDFAHDGNDEALFNNFTLSVKPGEKIGLVGHSGSGKTTLTRLLLRFSDVDNGEITIDGQNITHLKQAELRKHIAYVPQEPLLFHRSLHDNIAYGNPSATEEQVRQAAKRAHADSFIDQLPSGYNTLVGERGVKLSGGQRQRIAIARAILKDAPILVLDEATSALDSESEKLIQAALKKLMKGRTTIVIAHRLSTIQNMDRIVVMDDGRIIEQGTHAQLLDQYGAYAKLWNHQSGGFIEE